MCYLPGCDLRRVNEEHMPYVSALLKDHPWAPATSYPSPEQLSTIITGQRPHLYGIWQARLRSEVQRTPLDRLIDTLPDMATTTAQCVWQQRSTSSSRTTSITR